MTLIELIPTILGCLGILSFIMNIYQGYQKDQRIDAEKIANTEKMDLILGSKVELVKSEFLGVVKLLETSLNGKIDNLTNAWIDVKKNDLHSLYEKQRDLDQQYHNVALELRQIATIINLKLIAENPKTAEKV